MKNRVEGHEVPLASMTKNKYTILIELMNGICISGVVTSFDRFSITVLVNDEEYPRTYFKHAIASFTRV